MFGPRSAFPAGRATMTTSACTQTVGATVLLSRARRIVVCAALLLLLAGAPVRGGWGCGPQMYGFALTQALLSPHGWSGSFGHLVHRMKSKSQGMPQPRPRKAYGDPSEVACWVGDVCGSDVECDALHGGMPSWNYFAICIDATTTVNGIDSLHPCANTTTDAEVAQRLERAVKVLARNLAHYADDETHGRGHALPVEEAKKDLLFLTEIVLGAHMPLNLCAFHWRRRQDNNKTSESAAATAEETDELEVDYAGRNFTVLDHDASTEVSLYEYVRRGGDWDLAYRIANNRPVKDNALLRDFRAAVEGKKLHLEHIVTAAPKEVDYGVHQWVQEAREFCEVHVVRDAELRRGDVLPWGRRERSIRWTEDRVALGAARLARILLRAHVHREEDAHLDEL